MGHGFIPSLPWVDEGNRSNDTLSHVKMVKTKMFRACLWSRSKEWRRQVAGEQLTHNTAWAGQGTPCHLLLMPGSNPFSLLSFIYLHWKDFSITAKCVLVFLSLGLRTCWQSHFLPTATLQLLNAKCYHITRFSDRAFQVFNLSFKWFDENAMIILLL